MGSFAGFLGDAAGGYAQAANADKQRDFQAEMDRRNALTDLLGKLAMDPTAHPETQQRALQGIAQIHSQPWNKPFKAEPIINSLITPGPTQPTQTATTQGQTAAPPHDLTNLIPPSQPMPTPPTSPGVAAPQIPQQAQFTPPPNMGMRYTPTEQAGMAAQSAGAVAGGKESGELAAFHQAYEQIAQQHPEWTQMQIMAAMGKTIPYSMVMGGMAGAHVPQTAGEARQDPEWAHLVPAHLQDADQVSLTRTRDGRPMTVTPMIIPSLATKTTTSSQATTTPGGLTTKRSGTRTTTPVLPGSSPMPTPPATAPAKQAKPATSGKAAVSNVSPAVVAAKESIKMFGLPQGKMNDAQSIALSQLKNEGWDPVPAGSPQARGRADSARSIEPLIQKARQLIAQNPDALGPLAGRWSDLQNKVGTLSGPAKELAGTLTSIYSLAGSMHGWRAIRVADEFGKTYGTLKNDAASLNSGLDAMLNTAHVVEHVGYPGLEQPPSPPAGGTTSGKKQFYRLNGKAYDAQTHQEIPSQ